MRTLTLTQARNQLLSLASDLERDPGMVVEVVKRGKPVLKLVSSELYDSIKETMEILEDPSAARKLRLALREVQQGKAIPWKAAKAKLAQAR